jgi:conjugative transfer signal peptidase TraF
MTGRGTAAALIAIGTGALGTTLVAPPPPLLVWNASASAPLGLYLVAPGRAPQVGMMVAARLPAGARGIASDRGYLPAGIPAVKRVAAAAGDRICALGATVLVNGKPVAVRLAADQAGRALPAWHGCVRLADGQFLLLMRGVPDSFDGRYFGVTRRAEIIGTATLLWRA